MVPCIDYAMLPCIDYAMLPCIDYAMLPCIDYAMLPCIDGFPMLASGPYTHWLKIILDNGFNGELQLNPRYKSGRF